VTVPKALLDRLGLGPEDKVQFLFDELSQEIVLVPDERVSSWVPQTSRSAPRGGERKVRRG